MSLVVHTQAISGVASCKEKCHSQSFLSGALLLVFLVVAYFLPSIANVMPWFTLLYYPGLCMMS